MRKSCDFFRLPGNTFPILVFLLCLLLFARHARSQNLTAQQQEEMILAVQEGAKCDCQSLDSVLQQQAAVQQIIGQTYNLAVVFVDFTDGRTDGTANGPYPDQATINNWYFTTGESNPRSAAVGSLGFRKRQEGEEGNLWIPTARKYEWKDYWNMYLSRNGEYRDNNATNYHPHPDYASHGERAGGSVVDYWNEASYGNADFHPYAFRSGLPDSLQGIVNEWEIAADGRRHIKWINMGISRGAAIQQYASIDNTPANYTYYNVEAKLRAEYSAGRISFNIDAFYGSPNSKLIAVYVGHGARGISSIK